MMFASDESDPETAQRFWMHLSKYLHHICTCIYNRVNVYTRNGTIRRYYCFVFIIVSWLFFHTVSVMVI